MKEPETECFIPVTEQLLENLPATATLQLVPYSVEYDCYRWLGKNSNNRILPEKIKPTEN